MAMADQLSDNIAALSAQANAQQAQANALHVEASTLVGKVGELNAQIGALQTKINLNQAKSAKLSQQIVEAKAVLVTKKAVLDESVRAIYVGQQQTPIELLASSDNFSDYYNKAQSLDIIKTRIQDSVDEIQKLKVQAELEQATVTKLLSEQSDMQQSIALQRQQVQDLLTTTQNNEANYQAQVRTSNSQAATLRAQQAAILAAQFRGGRLGGGGSCGGGYPGRWCQQDKDSLPDDWGMYNRECVSYTAFRVANSGRYMPYWGGRGNANQWPSNARSAGIAVDSRPRPGDVAISTAGPYGHAMYVEGVSGGSITVSQYNFANDGNYSTMTISASGLYFLHF